MKRYNIDAPCNNQYEEHPEGEWVTYEDAQTALDEALDLLSWWRKDYAKHSNQSRATLALLTKHGRLV